MLMHEDRQEFYKERYSGSLFLIKAGGRVITDPAARTDLLNTIKDLVSANIRVLLIFGGGQAIDEELAAHNITPRKQNGRRITDQDTIKLVKKVLCSDLCFRVSQTMAEIGLKGLCLNHIPADWADIELRERDDPKDYGYDGTIKKVYPSTIYTLMNAMPFIACPCLGVSEKTAININADNVAVGLAAGCQFRKLVFLSDVDGVQIDGEIASIITDKQIPQLIKDGVVTGGMQVKLESCLYALERGVRRIHLINGFVEGNLANEIYRSVGPGTMMLRETDLDRYEQEIKMEASS